MSWPTKESRFDYWQEQRICSLKFPDLHWSPPGFLFSVYQVLFPREAKPATQLHVEAGLGMRGAICPLYTPAHRHRIHSNNFAFTYQTLPTLQY